MDETRESCLAAILARGVLRVLQSRERAGTQKPQCDEELGPSVAAATDGNHQCSHKSITAKDH